MNEEIKISCGKYVADNANLSESKFHNVKLMNLEITNANMTGARFHDINLSDARFSAMQMGGTKFIHIGLPPNKDGKQNKQRGISFEEAHLNDSIFKKCKMTDVKIVDCEIDGMEIDGVNIEEAINYYRKNKR